MISAINLFTNQYIGGGSNVTSAVIPLMHLSPDAKLFFDMKAAVGRGAVKGEYLLANLDTETFLEPTGATDIFSGHKLITGTGGRNFYAMTTPILAPLMKVKISQTDGTNVTVTANLIIVDSK